ncbi:cytosolic sulfotransferase 7-like [Sesamum indicum]|uniref:Sulfotransferase n=1 Tax=Sesamum indicum TaxID=4182 RepID=A0A6I9TER6_SESIN|nr:cytosolic sulfotransferase 7-like [Sesamum indicum]
MEDSSFDLDLELSSLPKEKWLGDDYLFQLGGFWHLPQAIQGVNRVINQFQPLPSDIILASFPKTGTTWLKALLYSIVNRSSKHRLTTENPHSLIPVLEYKTYGTTHASSTANPPCHINDSRRILSTHIPYQLLAKTLGSSECRVVYVTRNPKDTLVSTWHFVNKWKKAKEEGWPFEVAVEKFCHGLIPCGPYYDHVMGYRKLCLDRPKYAHFLTYEGLKNDPKTHVKKLAEFLGCPFQGEDAEAQVQDLVNGCSFEVLSNHEVNMAGGFPSRIAFIPSNSFFRKGVVGDYKEHMSAEVVQKIDALTKEKFHSFGFIYGV